MNSLRRDRTTPDAFSHPAKIYRYRMTSEELPAETADNAAIKADKAAVELAKLAEEPEGPAAAVRGEQLLSRHFKLATFASDIEYRTKAWKLCKEYLAGRWKTLDKEEFQIRRISGGLSNHIFQCSLPSAPPSSSLQDETEKEREPQHVLLRLYGGTGDQGYDLTAYITSHVIDNVVFTLLSERGLGPRLLGVFPEGRLEEFIPSRAVTPAEVVGDAAVSAAIARKVRRVHALVVPINKQEVWLQKMFDRFRQQVENLTLGEVDPQHHRIAAELLYFDFATEINWLLGFLSESGSPIVFCHNDVQGGNVLMRKDAAARANIEDRLMIIDYEFCGYNYRGYDLANHFCEWMYDYSNKAFPYYHRRLKDFPSKKRQKDFLRVYLTPEEVPILAPMANGGANRNKNGVETGSAAAADGGAKSQVQNGNDADAVDGGGKSEGGESRVRNGNDADAVADEAKSEGGENQVQNGTGVNGSDAVAVEAEAEAEVDDEDGEDSEGCGGTPKKRPRRRVRSAAGCISMYHGGGGGAASCHGGKTGGVKRVKNTTSIEENVESLYAEVNRFLLAPPLLWCMWAMVQSTNDKIPFGYWNFAEDKMRDYQDHKSKLLKELYKE